MSETSPEPRTAASPRPKASQGPKHAGLTTSQWGIVGVGLAGVAGIILIVRKRKASSAASSATTTANTAQATGSCADGSTVPCGGLCPDGTAPSGCSTISNSTLQTELGDLESQLAQGGGSGGGGGLTSGGTPAPASAATTTGTTGTTGTSTATATTAKTTTSTAPAAAKAGAISNLQASKVGSTTATVSWNKAANASQGYAWRVTNLKTGDVTHSGNTMSTSVNLTGLGSKTSFNFGVQGLPGGPGDNIHFTTT